VRPQRVARGFTLLEVLIALAVMLVGLLGLMRLQVFGIQANQGSRAHSTAVAVARELALGLERLDFNDPLLTANGVGATPPSPFGHLLNGTTLSTGTFTTWDDGAHLPRLPGVRPDTALEREPGGTPVFARRWTVWSYQGSAGPVGSKIIAVSVVFHERASPVLYEIVYLTSVRDPSSISAGALVGSQAG
jgi:prepilin-type N-terminal cleavage/methylation domain-containing protein